MIHKNKAQTFFDFTEPPGAPPPSTVAPTKPTAQPSIFGQETQLSRKTKQATAKKNRSWVPTTVFRLPISDAERSAANEAALSLPSGFSGELETSIAAGFTGSFGCGDDGEYFRPDFIADVIKKCSLPFRDGSVFVSGPDIPALIGICGFSHLPFVFSESPYVSEFISCMYPGIKLSRTPEPPTQQDFVAQMNPDYIVDGFAMLSFLRKSRQRAMVLARPGAFLDAPGASGCRCRADVWNEFDLPLTIRFLPRNNNGGGVDLLVFDRRNAPPIEKCPFLVTGSGYLPWQKANEVFLKGAGVFLNGSEDDEKRLRRAIDLSGI